MTSLSVIMTSLEIEGIHFKKLSKKVVRNNSLLVV